MTGRPDRRFVGASAPPATPGQEVAEGWASYVDLVVPANAGAHQRLETRRAFYAGALLGLGVPEGRAWQAACECVDFIEKVQRGEA